MLETIKFIFSNENYVYYTIYILGVLLFGVYQVVKAFKGGNKED